VQHAEESTYEGRALSAHKALACLLNAMTTSQPVRLARANLDEIVHTHGNLIGFETPNAHLSGDLVN